MNHQDCEARLRGEQHPTHGWTYWDGRKVICEDVIDTLLRL